MRRLLIRPGAIGDCILAMPAMEHLRSSYTEVWVPEPVVPLIRFGDRVCSIASTGLDLLGLPDVDSPSGLIERLKTFDSIVSWYGTNRAEFRSAIAKLGLPIEFLTALPDATTKLHAADYFLQQVGAPIGGIPRIDCLATSAANFAAVHPFSGSSRKNWPVERFQEVAARLPLAVRWTAGPEENIEQAERFESLYDLACWLHSASIYLGNDSGITHLAAAVGVPTVAIFGPTDPARWAPRGGAVRIVAGDLHCVHADEVLEAALQLLKR